MKNQANRTIPANTGRIDGWELVRDDYTDHPREYGENVIDKAEPAFMKGPSPRIRGEFWMVLSRRCQLGTIPANTGRILADLRKPDQQD